MINEKTLLEPRIAHMEATETHSTLQSLKSLLFSILLFATETFHIISGVLFFQLLQVCLATIVVLKSYDLVEILANY